MRCVCAEHAVVKSYTLKGEQNGKEDRFVAYMLPAHTPPDRDAGAPSTSRRALFGVTQGFPRVMPARSPPAGAICWALGRSQGFGA